MKKTVLNLKPYAAPRVQAQVFHLELGILTGTTVVEKSEENDIDLDY